MDTTHCGPQRVRSEAAWEPPGLNELEWAEELGARWKGDELVTYDYPTFIDLLEYYEKNEYLPDND
jgi:hypothetical protein